MQDQKLLASTQDVYFVSLPKSGTRTNLPDLPFHDGIENADLRPVVLLFRDKIMVARRILVCVMGILVHEYQVQRYVEIADVNFTVERLCQHAGREEDRARVAR